MTTLQPSPTLDNPARKTVARVLRYISLILIILFLVSPLFAFFMNAFSFRWFYPQFIPNEWSIQAWEAIFAENFRLWEALGNSIVIALVVTVFSIIIGLPTARAMGMYQFRGKRIVEFLILAPIIVPGVSISLGLNINFIRWGLSGTVVGVMLVHLVPVMPYVVLTLSGVFANYNADFEDQARTLGASPIATFRHVTLPSIFPGIMVAGLFAFLVSWGQYILTFLIGAGQVTTMPILLLVTEAGGKKPDLAALSLIFIGPALLILILTSRYLSGTSAIGGFGKI